MLTFEQARSVPGEHVIADQKKGVELGSVLDRILRTVIGKQRRRREREKEGERERKTEKERRERER